MKGFRYLAAALLIITLFLVPCLAAPEEVLSDAVPDSAKELLSGVDTEGNLADGLWGIVENAMGELGAEDKELHAMVGRHFEGKQIDALFTAGELSAELAKAARACSPQTEVHETQSKERLIEELLAYRKEGDTILVKASHFMGFTEVVRALTEA